MPVAVSYPGVYIQEVPSGVHTITGVSTSIGAFFGRTAKGPINRAVHCLSFADFLREFGGPHPLSDLAQSVKQFFDNGGTDCYVVRVAHNAAKADITLRNLANTAVLQVTAKDAGNWGNGVRLEVDYKTTNPEETFNLRAIHEDNGAVVSSESFLNLSMNPNSPRYAPNFVTQSSKLVDLALVGAFSIESTPQQGFSEGRRPFDTSSAVGDPPTTPPTTLRDWLNGIVYPSAPGATSFSRFEISVNDGPYTAIDLQADATLFSGATNTVAGQLGSKINAQLPTGVTIACTAPAVTGVPNTNVMRISSTTGNQLSVRIRRASSNDFAGPLMLGIDQGGIEVTRYGNHRPVPTATFYSDSANRLAALAQNAFNQLTFVGAPPPGNVVALDASGTNVLVTTVTTQPWFRDALASAVSDHNDGVREKLAILAKAINDTPGTPARAEVWGYHLALVSKTGTMNSQIIITTSTTNIWGFFTANVRQYSLGNAGTSPFQAGAGQLGRDDDGTPLVAADFIGSALDHSGFNALDKVDLFNLMILPGDREVLEPMYLQLIGPASIYCNQHRAFLLVDAPDSWTDGDLPNADASAVNSLRALVVKDHSAVFYPKVQYSDAGLKKLIGPSGMIAGLMARTDSTRGVWKAPAGTEADLRGVLDLEVNLTDLENGVLNKLGVNCLRKFPTGIVNWGARTLDGSDDIGSEWKYIPIRRLALFLEESLFRGTKWVVFEPNDEPLWASIRLNLNAFMMSLFRQGAFQGSTPDKAFYVKCDGETTTQNDRNLGIVNIEVGFAPLKPAEFVIIKIQQIAGDLT